jgi:hypothetical protein
MGGHPITHGPGAVGRVDLIPIELTEIPYLLRPQPADLGLFGKNPLLQLVNPFIPIPAIEHTFDYAKSLGQKQDPRSQIVEKNRARS